MSEPLLLENLVDCLDWRCGTTFDVAYRFPDSVTEVEDIVEAPTMVVTCPACGVSWEREWEGWVSHDDAG